MSDSSFEMLGRVSMQDDASPVLQGISGNMQSMSSIGVGAAVAVGMAVEQFIVGTLQAAIGVVEQFASAAMDAAAAQQVFDQAVENLSGPLGSFQDQVNQLAASVPIPKDMIESAIEMQLQLGQTRDAALAQVTAFANLSAAGGVLNANINSVLERFDLMAQQGSITSLALRSFAMAGIDLLPILENTASGIVGTPVTSLKQINALLKSGKITWDEMMQGVITAGSKVGPQVAAMGDTWAGMGVKFKNMMDTIGASLITPVLDQLSKTLGPVFDGISKFVASGAASQLGAGLMNALKPIGDILGPVVAKFSWFFEEIEHGVPLGDALQELLKQLIPPNILAALQNIGSTLMKVLGQDGPIVISNLQKLFADLATFWQRHGDQIIAIVTSIINILIHLLGAATVVITGILDLWMRFDEGVTGAIDFLITHVPQFIAIGRSFVDGMVQGVVDGTKGLIDAAVKAVSAAYNAAKAFLHIKCPDPSPVFAELGTGISEGMAVGISGGAANVSRAAVGTLSATAGAVGGMGGGGGVVDNSDNHTVDITFTGPITLSGEIDWAAFSSRLRSLSTT